MNALCLVCGATMTLLREWDRPHCKTLECATGYAPILVESRTRTKDGHLIWDGAYHPNSGRPYISLNYHKGRQRKSLTINPMFMLWAGPQPKSGHTLSRACEEPRCISHLEIRSTKSRRPQPPEGCRPRTPKLPVMPLIRAISEKAAEFSLRDADRMAIKWAQEHSGQIDLYIADRICIDTLHIHPYFVWGQTFYDAA